MTDEMRDRLTRLDPMRQGVSTESVATPSSRKLLEDIMSTHVEESTAPRTTRWLPAAAVVVVVAGVIGALTLGGGGGEPLSLSAGVDNSMTSCIQFSEDVLAKMPVAFEGTVTSADGETIGLEVDHWFKGGDASQVVINAPAGMEALIGGIPFEVGESYLITANDGTVNYCGFSGVSTPELRGSFEAAFAG